MGIVFIGSQQIGHDCLTQIIKMKIKVDAVFTFKPDQHEQWKKSVDVIAKNEKIPLFFSEKLTVKKIKEIKPELIIVAGYRKIFPEDILKIPKRGIIGLHGSLLPHLRGFAPLNWAIINGEKKTGITMFFMNEFVDRGDIIDQKEIKITNKDTIEELKVKIARLAVDLIKENLVLVLEGKEKRRKQPEEGTYGCKRIPLDGLINWNKSNVEIFNLIRGLDPSYPAFTFLNSQKICITKARITPKDSKYFGIPGQIAQIFEDGSVDVITGNGLLKISKIRLNNEKDVNAKDILNSYSIRMG